MKFERLDSMESEGEYVIRKFHVIKGDRGKELGLTVLFDVKNYLDYGDDWESDYDRGIYSDMDGDLINVDMSKFLEAFKDRIDELEIENKDGEEWDTPCMLEDLSKLKGLEGYIFFK